MNLRCKLGLLVDAILTSHIPRNLGNKQILALKSKLSRNPPFFPSRFKFRDLSETNYSSVSMSLQTCGQIHQFGCKIHLNNGFIHVSRHFICLRWIIPLRWIICLCYKVGQSNGVCCLYIVTTVSYHQGAYIITMATTANTWI